MQFYPPFSSFFSTFGVKAANGINKMFKFSPHKVSFLKPREQECVNFFSKIFGVQIKKWQKKKYPAKENREQRTGISVIFAKPNNRIGRRHMPASLKKTMCPIRGAYCLTEQTETDSCKSGVSLIDDYRIRD